MEINLFIEEVKKYSKELTNSNLEKKAIKVYNPITKEYDIGCIINQILEMNKYEVYMFAGKCQKCLTSNLATKLFENEKEANEYFEILAKNIEEKKYNVLITMIKNV